MDNVDKIKSKFPLIFDGAMGTYYRDKVENALPECEMANIFDRDVIFNIHKEYLDAGAVAIKTNTFGANKESLNCSDDVLSTIIESGYRLAQDSVKLYCKDNKIAREDRFVFADIGPISHPSDSYSYKDLVEEYVDIVDKFLELGAKNFIFETLDEDIFLLDVCNYIRKKEADSFIMVSFAINPDGYTRKGYYGEELIENISKSNLVDSVGFNCISGPGYLLKTIEKINLPESTISIMPNASYPTIVSNRVYYSDNASYFANAMMDFLDYGVEIIGGCCGTTPKHIDKINDIIGERKDIKSLKKLISTDKIESMRKIKTKKNPNLFYDKLCSSKKVIAVELDPPADINIEKYMENAYSLKKAGVDAITIADCPVARARIDSSLMAYKIKNELDIEPIVHLTCRDRNLNATKALLLGLNIENIRNLIIVTGDPIPNAEKNEIKPVFNFNSRILSQYIRELNEKIFTNNMMISSGLNINARNFAMELEKAKKKEEAGVEVFFTQAILSEKAIENLDWAKKVLKSKVMGGIIPIVSYRNAVFMNEEISGISVGKKIIEKYNGVSKEKASRLAVEISLEFMRKIEDKVDGFYLITPFSRVEIIEEIMKKYIDK
ncbi:MAG: bifunctional homocysteine S-methyltransferase/methylenetetrahydrofolate reductase [Peptostreptococcus sp.]|uniref:bifunctional homocysteine S-methyltransferase/methylenetetrahydrofolate reductase n=1 Tax=Peptostreptococcus sp. TaxID=1262 RepID=UPI002FC912F9